MPSSALDRRTVGGNSPYLRRQAVFVTIRQRQPGGIKDVAAGIIASLPDYGVTEAELTALQTAIDEYKAMESSPRLGIIDRKAATGQIGMLISENSRILKNQLDKLIGQLEEENPEFYRDYFNAREIIDLKGGNGKSNGEVKDAGENSNPLSP